MPSCWMYAQCSGVSVDLYPLSRMNDTMILQLSVGSEVAQFGRAMCWFALDKLSLRAEFS